MKAIIMAGGFGTRLRPLTNNLPKPMVPIANRPIIEHIVDLLKVHSITDITSLLYFQPALISDHFGDASAFGVNMKYTSPTADLGTAGAVAFAAREAKELSTTLVISGDVVTDIDLTAALKFHKKSKAKATIVLTRVENPLPFGIVITDESGQIIRFLEKPGWGEVFSDTINTGIYILERDVIDYIPQGEEFDFSKDLFPALMADNQPLYGFIAEGYWKDVGSLEEFRASNMDVLHNKVSLNIPGKESARPGIWIDKGSKVDFNAVLEGCVIIGANCSVSPNTKIKNSVIGDNSVIEEGAVVCDSVLWNDVHVGEHATMHENIISSHTEIGSGAYLDVGAIISDHCRIGRRSRIKANVKVWPHKTVDDDATLAASLIWGQRWAKNIFGAHGVTGLANIELSPEFAAKLGAAYGASFRKGSTVSTSRDVHKTSRMINRAVMTGILSTGVNVDDYGVSPIPVVRYLASHGAEQGGIHTRRSPFNPQILDLKVFDNLGLDLHPSKEKTIERLFFREDFERVAMEDTGELTFPVHGFETYRSGFLSKINAKTINNANFKVVLDYSFGSTSRIFPAILGGLNCEMIALNANLDGTKLTKTTEEFNKSLTQLSNIVRSLGADIGVLFDSGGEKIFLVDETGDILDTDTALNLITLLSLKTAKANKQTGRLAVPVTASRAIDEMAATYGFEVVRTKTSARGIMEAASKENILFVGEPYGGYIFPEFHPAFDGMYALVKILEMLAVQDITLHKLLREIPPSIIIKDRISCPWEIKGKIMRQLTEVVKDKDTELIDGIKINFKKNWIAALPSQDEPYFNLIAEADTHEAAKKLIGKYSDKIKSWQM